MIEPTSKTNIYEQYTYSYPHKHSYRELEKPIHLSDLWQKENKQNLFAYLHIPYCKMRCGFCNLFTIANPKNGVGEYLEALKRETIHYRESIPDMHFEEYAIGGGTPTFLSELDLERMLSIFKSNLGVDTQHKYGSIEASPKSINEGKIKIIENYGIDRISMGIQSWVEDETKMLGRPQTSNIVTKAIEQIKISKIQELNLDLIYGIHMQTKKSWLYSLEKTLAYKPTEIFLYPLYTRPLTGLSKMQHNHEDNRLYLYRIGRDYLKESGYVQISMRCFRRADADAIENNYTSVMDGMVGIGAGARSYTRDWHYSTNYAVSRKATKAIIHDYSQRKDFSMVNYGFYLNKEEKMRRFIIKSLIDGGKLNVELFEKQFNKNIFSIKIINQLLNHNWLEEKGKYFYLNEKGMEMEDYIGPLLFSENVKKLMDDFQLN